ncbi:MAG TPA: hypothetical protein VMH32_13015 [Burkholderiales bacterium]|nr:hypothetical protein [Burkholderiales bacterium]
MLSFAGLCTAAATDEDALVGGFFPYRAFQQLPATRIEAGGGALTVAFGPGELALSREAILAWVRNCVRAVADYYGRLPDPDAKLLIVPIVGAGVRGGSTYGYRGAASRILLGRDTTQAQLAEDWVLVHELVHQGFPMLSDEHHWMEEGLATYVEPVARAQAGELSVRKVWGDLVRGLPQGLPREGDRGLDHTPTWGRTYWGGALFYLLADIEIRRRTDNRRGLQDALREIVASGGNISQRWPMGKVLAVADQGTGTHALTELYERMKDTPVNVDLAGLWRELGVSMNGGLVTFDDSAPLGSIRRAITASSELR